MDLPDALQPRPKRYQLPKQIKKPVLVSLLITSLICFFSIFIYTTNQPELPLFYSLSQPEDQIVKNEWIFVLPIIAVLLFIFHLFTLNVLSKIDNEVMRLYTWITVFLLGLILFIFIRLLIVL